MHKLLFLKGSINLNSPSSKSSCNRMIFGLSLPSISLTGFVPFLYLPSTLRKHQNLFFWSILQSFLRFTISPITPSVQLLLSPTSTSQQCTPELKPCEASTPPCSLFGLSDTCSFTSTYSTLMQSSDTCNLLEAVSGSRVTGAETQMSVNYRAFHQSVPMHCYPCVCILLGRSVGK